MTAHKHRKGDKHFLQWSRLSLPGNCSICFSVVISERCELCVCISACLTVVCKVDGCTASVTPSALLSILIRISAV